VSSPRHAAAVPKTTVYVVGEGDEDTEGDPGEFVVTPRQIATLRKEAGRREARKILPKVFLSAADDGGEGLEEAAARFAESELVELRGVSRASKRQVFDTAYALAAALEERVGRPVVVVEVKGFTARLYCPWDEESRAGRLVLRHGYRPGQWTSKSKPVRDERGQIMKDENGVSIKE